eukprot:GABV01001530.1.p2 GENE.GABV01001530.1~~GABV01001530.1.p2  ORF type:complete len:117 (-),score=24.26 GABV01001530.1:17-367(-)
MTSVLLVDIVFWAVLCPDRPSSECWNFSSTNMHLVNFFVMAIEFWINKLGFAKWHFFTLFVPYLFSYQITGWTWYSAHGEWIYGFLNVQPATWVAWTLGLVLGAGGSFFGAPMVES